MTLERPKLRSVEALPLEGEQEGFVGLRDPFHFSPQILVLNPATLYLVSLMDGTRTIPEIQADFTRLTSAIIPTEKIEALVKQLDESLYLESDRFLQHANHLINEFQRLPVKPMFHQGAYPSDPSAYKDFVSELLIHSPPPPTPPVTRKPGGYIIPHIDLPRGAEAYAAAFNLIQRFDSSDLYIILGTSHYHLVPDPFTLTMKDFETPLGDVETDKAAVEHLRAALPYDPFVGEFAHRAEHSIEFQAVLLKGVLPERPFKILPVLCGPFNEYFENGAKDPLANPAVAAFIKGVKEVLRAHPAACLIASVDFSHVGPKFGDDQPVDSIILKLLESYDSSMLKAIQQGNAAPFFAAVAKERNRTHMDAVSPVVTLLAALDRPVGTLLAYRQAYEEPTQSVVSFASLAFTSGPSIIIAR
ncbi:MAG: AmmeMemoRadiSam system protein B [bacterium]